MRKFINLVRAGSTSVTSRLARGFAANAFGKLWVILVQVLSVPVLTAKWGGYDYGVWLMLTTIPTYLALGDFGFGAAAAADMTHKFAVGDRHGALGAFQAVWSLVSSVLLLVMALAAVGVILVVSPDDPQLKLIAAGALLACGAFFAVQMSMLSIGFRSTGRYAMGTALLDMSIPIEGIAVILAAMAGGNFIPAASSILAVRIIAFFLYYRVLQRYEPWIRLGWSQASWAEIKRLAHPALAALGISLSTALSLQGVVLAIGTFISPAIAAVYSTSRTLTRLPLQITGMVGRAAVPEITRAHALGNRALASRLETMAIGLTAAITLPAAAFFSFFGQPIQSLLTHGQLKASPLLFLIMAGIATMQAAWGTIGQFLFAINKQQKFAHYYIPLAAVSALAPVFLAPSLEYSATLILAAESAMVAIVVWIWLREKKIAQHNAQVSLLPKTAR